MALIDEIKDGLGFLKALQAKAAGRQDDIQTAADQLEGLVAALRSLAGGDSSKLNVTLTQFEGVNRLLAAKASAEEELAKGATPDWNRIGDGIATVAGVAVKIGLVVAGAA